MLKTAAISVVATTAAIALLAAAVLIPSGSGTARAADAPAASGYRMVAPLEAVMEVVGEVYKRMPERLKAGTPKDLKAIRMESLFIAEIGNMTGRLHDRAADADWKAFSEALKTQALSLAEAAAKKDTAKIEALHKGAGGACRSCHDKYRDA